MRKRPRPDQIAAILRDFQADLDAGLNIGQACRKAGIGPTTYYRWKALQENPLSNEQLRVSELESDVARLKLLVAELALDRRMLQEAEKKAMTSPRRRLIADELCDQFDVSQRRAARALDLPRSSLRYVPVFRDEEAALARRIEELARAHPRYGYRRIWALLARRLDGQQEGSAPPLPRAGVESGPSAANPKPRREHGQDKNACQYALVRQGRCMDMGLYLRSYQRRSKPQVVECR